MVCVCSTYKQKTPVILEVVTLRNAVPGCGIPKLKQGFRKQALQVRSTLKRMQLKHTTVPNFQRCTLYCTLKTVKIKEEISVGDLVVFYRRSYLRHKAFRHLQRRLTQQLSGRELLHGAETPTA